MWKEDLASRAQRNLLPLEQLHMPTVTSPQQQLRTAADGPVVRRQLCRLLCPECNAHVWLPPPWQAP